LEATGRPPPRQERGGVSPRPTTKNLFFPLYRTNRTPPQLFSFGFWPSRYFDSSLIGPVELNNRNYASIAARRIGQISFFRPRLPFPQKKKKPAATFLRIAASADGDGNCSLYVRSLARHERFLGNLFVHGNGFFHKRVDTLAARRNKRVCFLIKPFPPRHFAVVVGTIQNCFLVIPLEPARATIWISGGLFPRFGPWAPAIRNSQPGQTNRVRNMFRERKSLKKRRGEHARLRLFVPRVTS